MRYHLTLVRMAISAICSNVDGPRHCHTSEVSQTEEKHHMTPLILICGI